MSKVTVPLNPSDSGQTVLGQDGVSKCSKTVSKSTTKDVDVGHVARVPKFSHGTNGSCDVYKGTIIRYYEIDDKGELVERVRNLHAEVNSTFDKQRVEARSLLEKNLIKGGE